jgi:proline iminopeptidase
MRTTGQWPIEYDTLGKPDDPAIVLIMGLAMQLTSWPEAFCLSLVDAGFRVVRFDNRDSGLSAQATGLRHTPLPLAFMASLFGLPVRSAYTLEDMATDAIGVLDALHISQAHVVGVSMGGMIAQVMAANFPHRVLSLTSMMSSSGNRRVSQPSTKAGRILLKRPANPNDQGSVVDHLVQLFDVIGSPDYPESKIDLRQRILKGVQRAYSPAGTTRQLIAILASGDRRKLLRTIKVPAQVIHGDADPLVPLAAGRDTVEHIAGAKFHVIPGMGHDLPAALLPQLAALIVAHCEGAAT